MGDHLRGSRKRATTTDSGPGAAETLAAPHPLLSALCAEARVLSTVNASTAPGRILLLAARLKLLLRDGPE